MEWTANGVNSAGSTHEAGHSVMKNVENEHYESGEICSS